MAKQHLSECIASLEELEKEARILLNKLSLEQLNWKPSPKAWSVAECIAHLLIVFEKYEPSVSKALSKNYQTENMNHKPSFFGKIFFKFVNPQSKKKIPAPSILKPTQSHYGLDIVEKYFAYLYKVKELMQAGKGKNLNKIKIPSSVSKLIRFNLGDYFQIEVWHNLRHFQQMLRICNEPDFPKK
ncbi:MAG: DinB family protein [Raineya sp.]